MKKTVILITINIILLITPIFTHSALPEKIISGSKVSTLAPIIKEALPAVVNISTTSAQSTNHPLFNNPLFREFYNIPPNYHPPKHKTQSAGSGVIIDSKKGIIITNHHVVEGADNIEVTLSNGTSIKAKLIGSDPEVDIAVLGVEQKTLSQVTIGKSRQLEVGDFVIAIGNPFGLNQTVTTGIVSALGRSGLGIEGYEDFIQTDASINPGNSGGALINLKGELIGINTAIISPAKGNVGIGFAIPIDMAMNSVEQIIRFGEVKRGQIGISIQDIDEDLAKAFNLKNRKGVLISSVSSNSSADKAGLKAGDVITSVNGNAITNVSQLRNEIGSKRIGTDIQVSIIRKSKADTLKVRIGKKPSDNSSFKLSTPISKQLEGIQLRENKDRNGLTIIQVKPGSPAFESGLRESDTILTANQQNINNINDLRDALKLNPTKLLLQIQRGQFVFFIVIH